MDRTTTRILTVLDAADRDIERIQREVRKIQQDLYYIQQLLNEQEPRENEVFLDAIECGPVKEPPPSLSKRQRREEAKRRARQWATTLTKKGTTW
jgi:hypothetical protein